MKKSENKIDIVTILANIVTGFVAVIILSGIVHIMASFGPAFKAIFGSITSATVFYLIGKGLNK